MTTKADLVDKISKKSGLTKKDSETALNSCLKAIEEDLASGGNLRITGFGTFSVVMRKERTGRNPQTGGKMTIPASNTVKFKPGKNLTEIIS